MGLDRLLRDLIASVTTALDEYRRQATEHFDDTVGPELVVDSSGDPSIAAAVARSRSVEADSRKAEEEIRETTVPGSRRTDRLLRTVKDAETVNRVARAELGMKSIVIGWYQAAAEALRNYPKLIQRFGAAIKLGTDVTQPFFERWHNFKGNFLKFVFDELRETGETFTDVGHMLEERRTEVPHDTAWTPGRSEPDQRRTRGARADFGWKAGTPGNRRAGEASEPFGKQGRPYESS